MKLKFVGVFFFLLLFAALVAPNVSFAEKVLVIDPGHGGKFTGTCGITGNETRYCERDANLSVALKLRDQLKSSGITVHLTRDSDKDFSSYLSGSGGDLDKRMEIANSFVKGNNDNSIFISIHHNANPRSPYVKGGETYYYDGVHHFQPGYPHDPLQIKYLPDNKRLAEEIHPRVINKLQLVDRGIHDDNSFFVIRNAQMPSVLVELGFMTNRDEEKRIKTSQYQTNAAEALADAVRNYFKVFEVYDSTGKKLATYKNKNEAISFASKQKVAVSVFDKDNQKSIYNNSKFAVYHRTDGYLGEFISKDEAIDFAKTKSDSRVVEKDQDWTVWSNYLEKNYYVYVNNILYNTFYEYNQALEYAKDHENAKLVRVSTQDVLWTNSNGVAVTKSTTVTKLAGQYRVTTSTEISKSMYPNGFDEQKQQKVVILATGYNAADALSAGPLSRVYDKAPILLSEALKLDQNVKDELIRLGAKKVIIIGGYNAISSNIESEIHSLHIDTERINGKNRYDTNRDIIAKLGNPNGMFVASGISYPDALSVAPIAASQNWGIVLTDKNEISNEALNALNGKPTLIIGGEAVISPNVESKIKSNANVENVERLAGGNRYDTLATVLWHFKDALQSEDILVSTGENFPDALASAPLSIDNNAPLILLGNDLKRNTESFLMEYAIANNIKNVKVIGGTLPQTLVDKMVSKVK